MSYPDPAVDLATALAAGGVITLLDGVTTVAVGYGSGASNILSGPERSSDAFTSNQLVNVIPSGGPPPAPIMGTGGDINEARVQVLVRSKMESEEAGRQLARAAARKLHKAVIAGYISLLLQETEPNYLGVDERGLHRFTFNMLVRWQS